MQCKMMWSAKARRGGGGGGRGAAGVLFCRIGERRDKKKKDEGKGEWARRLGAVNKCHSARCDQGKITPPSTPSPPPTPLCPFTFLDHFLTADHQPVITEGADAGAKLMNNLSPAPRRSQQIVSVGAAAPACGCITDTRTVCAHFECRRDLVLRTWLCIKGNSDAEKNEQPCW